MKEEMPLLFAVEILQNATRNALVDHAFGDEEAYWFDGGGKAIACGYGGSSGVSVSISETGQYADTIFRGDYDLFRNGKSGKVERNDSGPQD